MGALDCPLAAAKAPVVAGDLRACVVDADLAPADHHADLGADQPPRDAVVVRVDVHAGVALYAPGQLAHLSERRTAVEWAQRRGLLAREPRDRCLACRAVYPHVGHLAHPPGEVSLQRAPRGKAPARDRVVLDVAHAALVLALGPGTVGRTRHRTHIPVASKRVEAGVERHLPRGRVMVIDEGPGVVDQHLAGQAAEMLERALDALQPLPLVPERLGIDPPRVAQGGDEQEQLARLAVLHHGPALAEVDLQLTPRRRLEPHRGQRLRRKLAPQMRHRPLHRAQADHHAQLGRQFLAHHVGVAAMSPQPIGHPGRVLGQLPGACRDPTRRPATGCHIALHGLPVAADFSRDPARAPAQVVQPQHRRHLVRRSHHLSPPVHAVRKNAQSIRHPASPCYAGWLGS